jgi:hypothetical protein
MDHKKSVPLSCWIEDTVRLPVGLSAEPGTIRLAPYMVEIADTDVTAVGL